MRKIKKAINVLMSFSIFHKNNIKTFLKLFINNCLKAPLTKSYLKLLNLDLNC